MSTPVDSPNSCTYCGVPLLVRRAEPGKPVYCCSGCLFADSLSQSLRQDRLSLWMVTAIASLFLVFNQVLFLLLGGKYLQDGHAAGAFLLGISLLAGLLAWGCAAGVAMRLHRDGQAPRPVVFIGIAGLFVAAIVAGIFSWAEWPVLARSGVALSAVVVVFCFLQQWLLRPFRRR